MEVNNAVLKLIIKECCRSSLLYNDEERQFMFPLKPGLNSIWPEIKSVIHTEHPDFHLSDFNQLLARLCDLRNQYTKIEVRKCTSDTFILTGEILELSLVDEFIPLRLIKMKEGQYLNASMGKGYTFGKNIEFINRMEEQFRKNVFSYKIWRLFYESITKSPKNNYISLKLDLHFLLGKHLEQAM